MKVQLQVLPGRRVISAMKKKLEHFNSALMHHFVCKILNKRKKYDVYFTYLKQNKQTASMQSTTP